MRTTFGLVTSRPFFGMRAVLLARTDSALIFVPNERWFLARIPARNLSVAGETLQRADESELDRLLAALGAAQPNSQYARGMIWREEG